MTVEICFHLTAWTMRQITSVGIDVWALGEHTLSSQAYRHVSASSMINIINKICETAERSGLNNTKSFSSVPHKDCCFVSDESCFLICIITPLILQMELDFTLLWCFRCLLMSVTVSVSTLRAWKYVKLSSQISNLIPQHRRGKLWYKITWNCKMSCFTLTQRPLYDDFCCYITSCMMLKKSSTQIELFFQASCAAVSGNPFGWFLWGS